MASIKYQCDTCKREITLPENKRGITVFSKCIITRGCKGSLYKIERSKNIINDINEVPEPVENLEDYTPRRVFYEHVQNISANPWKINHNLGVSPAVTVYFFDNVTNRPVEVSPDEYTVNVVDKNNIEISYSTPVTGIAQLIARSSVPRDVVLVNPQDNLLQVSNEGIITLAVSSISINPDFPPTGVTPTPSPSPTISLTPSVAPSSGASPSPTPTNTPTPTPSASPSSVRQKWIFDDTFETNVKVLVPSNPEEESTGAYIKDSAPLSSPWFNWDQILIRKRRNYAVKSFSILEVIKDIFPNIKSLTEIPNGTSFTIPEINVGFGLKTVESRQLFLLLGRPPYGISEKIRGRIVDVGELAFSQNGRFFIFDGEVFLDESNVERVYPLIEQTNNNNLLASPTPTPTFTPTPTPTSSVTPTVTPTLTPTFSPTPTLTPPVSPNPLTPTPSATSTPQVSVTPTPTRTPSPSSTPDVTPTPSVTPSSTPPAVILTDINISSSGTFAGFRLRSDGVLDINAGSGYSPRSGQWWSASPQTNIGNSYYVRLEQNGAGISIPSGPALDTWHQLNSNRTWFESIDPENIAYFTGSIFISTSASFSNVVASANVSILLDNTR